MIITHHSGSCFKIQFGDIVLACNPPSKQSALKSNRFGADIVLVTTNHEDMNGKSEIGVGERQPFVIEGPGEYEVKDVFIRGFASETRYGGESLLSTVYTIALEGMNICFCGPLGTPELPDGMRQAMEHVDILFVPVGSSGVLSVSQAAKVSVLMEPNIIIPIPFGDDSEHSVKAFLKEMGAGSVTPIDKLTIKKRDLEGKDGEVVLLQAST